jgi:hypothetical protein
MLSPLSISTREKNFVTPLDLPSRGEDISPLFLPYFHRRQVWGESVILLAILLVTPLDLPSRGEGIRRLLSLFAGRMVNFHFRLSGVLLGNAMRLNISRIRERKRLP